MSLSNDFDPRPPRFRLGIPCFATVSEWDRCALSGSVIHLTDIPVVVSPGRLADPAGLSLEQATAFVERAAPLLAPCGKFDRVDPRRLLADVHPLSVEGWGETVVIGAVCLGPGLAGSADDLAEPAAAFPAFTRLALRDALDYLEYRVRLFLKPSELVACSRLLPGNEELPLAAGPIILQSLGPEDLPGLVLSPAGEIDPQTGAVVLFTTQPQDRAGVGCEHCPRLNCPGRIQAGKMA